MTKEEIIDNIARLNSQTWKDREEVRTEIGKLLAELNKSLEQQPSEDCVSKAEVFEIMGNLMSIPYDFDRPIHEDDVSESMDEIKALPPVTPTRKSGLHWIERFNNEDKWLECPYCHKDSDNAYNYCPNCGAEMESEEDRND